MSQQNAELIFIRISLRSRFTMHIKHDQSARKLRPTVKRMK